MEGFQISPFILYGVIVSIILLYFNAFLSFIEDKWNNRPQVIF